MRQFFVYIITNKYNEVLYTVVTKNLAKRIYEHKSCLVNGFSKKYNLHKLVYYESTNSVVEAITREKRIKKWRREYKINLINNFNPEWLDLYISIVG